jgi:hypothetical protein
MHVEDKISGFKGMLTENTWSILEKMLEPCMQQVRHSEKV